MGKRRGFSPIELLIVLVILSILVGIVAMSMGGSTESAKRRGIQPQYDTAQVRTGEHGRQGEIVSDSRL